MTGRSVPTWVGKTPDSAIPARVKARIYLRCEGKCALTGRKLRVGDPYDFDHIIPLGMGGAHAETNLQVVSKAAHIAKTREDVDAITKARRVHLKHIGAWKKPTRTIQSRGFQPGRNAGFAEKERG